MVKTLHLLLSRKMRFYAGMALLSVAVLLLQVALTRVFSIAQFYHFAFLIVSLALLGFGASGTVLSIMPSLRFESFYGWHAVGFALATLVSYLFVNTHPFDSYSIAWNSNQVNLLIGNLLSLALPFVFAGMLIGALLRENPASAGQVYSANLLGSAAGAILAPIAIASWGSERTILLSVCLGALAAWILATQIWNRRVASVMLILGIALFIVLPDGFQVQPSEYKMLSHFRRNPDAEIITSQQNAYSRIDIVHSPTIHSAPGLSLTYFGDLPRQYGLLIDGDNMLVVSEKAETSERLLQALPVSVAYAIRPDADVLLLGSGGGMDILAAQANNARQVTVIEPNDLIYKALTSDLREWAGIADNSNIILIHDEIRSHTQRVSDTYDVVQLVLRDNYRPITSGAFTLTEDYTLTVEAMRAYLNRAGEDGLLVINRWLQSPPSETLRVLALVTEALESENPAKHIVVFRSFQLATFIVKPTPFTRDEVAGLLASIEQLRFDLVLSSENPDNMINQYAILEAPIYHQTFVEFLSSINPSDFYQEYPFDVTPPTDDHPFFFHFFRWEQTPDVIENLGKRWQPFGGSGYFVLLALLAFALASALVFILLPVALLKRFRQVLREQSLTRSFRVLAYFASIGLAFLMVEIALIQQYILVLGQPTFALATVIGVLLMFSGIGSNLSGRFRWRPAMIGLGILLIVYSLLMKMVIPGLLSLPLIMRFGTTAILIAPIGLLMGIPFPKGIVALQNQPDLVPWAWAVNGSASVITAILAIILALSLGFTAVLMIGGGLYLGASFLAD